MHQFVPYKNDPLAKLLNEKGSLLYDKMSGFNVDELGLSEHGSVYFKGSHLKRLFFSIQTSAHILYNSIRLVNKPVAEIVLMDYGAGLGSLYLLAKLIGCKKVVYNDILEDWKSNALKVAEAVGINVDAYIVGDIVTTLHVMQEQQIACNIITSRNVIEHIYQLSDFYAAIANLQPQAIVYSSTTANFYNPAMHVQHVLLHKRVEKIYYQHRYQLIKAQAQQLTESEYHQLAKLTRGYEKKGIEKVVKRYAETKALPTISAFYTNTCDTEWGVWAENLLPFAHHRSAAENANLQVIFKPGFWDTHYQQPIMNVLGKTLNVVGASSSWMGYLTAPFIYVIALPKTFKAP